MYALEQLYHFYTHRWLKMWGNRLSQKLVCHYLRQYFGHRMHVLWCPNNANFIGWWASQSRYPARNLRCTRQIIVPVLLSLGTVVCDLSDFISPWGIECSDTFIGLTVWFGVHWWKSCRSPYRPASQDSNPDVAVKVKGAFTYTVLQLMEVIPYVTNYIKKWLTWSTAIWFFFS